MRPQLVPLLVAGVDQRQSLQEQHRKDAGHEVQQQPAEKSEEGDAGERGEGERGRRCGYKHNPTHNPGHVHRRGNLIIPSAREFEHALQLRGAAREVWVFLEIEYQPPYDGRHRLRSGIVDDVLVGGEKDSGRFPLAGFYGKTEALLSRLENCMVV